MKKISYLFAVYFIASIVFVSCTKNEINPDSIVDPEELDNPINDFVWKGMNSWYNWQSNVTNLSDTKDDNLNEYYEYLNSYVNPEDLFDDLLYDQGNTDRFSWFIEDYVVQNQQFQGISLSFGFRLQGVFFNDNDAILYVRYVAPNSPASVAGIKRGDIINGLNGTVLNQNNYYSEVDNFSNETITLTFVSESGGILTPIEDKTITAVVLSENPVHFQKVFNDIDGKKVGYLVYNAFRSSYNDELNAAFEFFIGEGINELVLDLRLNGGGSVLTSTYLASMIYQNAGTDVFAELNFNDKHSVENGSYDFQDSLNIYDSSGSKTGEELINRLNTINRLYVLTSGSTASASEMIINGIKAFIDVKLIGTTTFGKNVGSITLYDSPSSQYTSEESANSSHKNAMQPIVFQIFNKLGQSDYTQGFTPDTEVKEYESWNNILPFGDENETLLKAALDNIRGLTSKSISTLKYKNIKEFDIPQLENRFEKEMYIGDEFFNR